MHPPQFKILKFNKLIMCGISPGNTSTDKSQELTIHEEKEVMHIQTNFISRSHTVKEQSPVIVKSDTQTRHHYNAEEPL